MAQKKEDNDKKSGVKIQDLAPSKDAKGGVARNTSAGGGNVNAGGGNANAGGGSANALRGQDSLRGQD